MTPEIRYWDLQNSRVLNNANKANSQVSKTDGQNNYKAFEAAMLNNLFTSPIGGGLSGFNAGSGNGFGSAIGNGFGSSSPMDLLFSGTDLGAADLQSKLNGAKNKGMEKVWAAQLSNQLPMLVQNQNAYANNSSNTGIGGLDKMISLTIQEQMIKARKVLENQAKTLVNTTPVKNDENQSMAQFIAGIQQQIEIASQKYGVSEDKLKEQIDQPVSDKLSSARV